MTNILQTHVTKNTSLLSALQLLKHVVKCGADGATVDWPSQAKALLAQDS
jgi:hypothetical protein